MPLTKVCRKKLHGNVVHIEATKVAFETIESRMISAPLLLIVWAEHAAEFDVATDAIYIIVHMLHQSLRLGNLIVLSGYVSIT